MENNEVQKKGIISVDIEKEMKDAYLQYSMSVIVGRALPDVRDGLKPVHRRVLFAMSEMGNTHDKAYKKSARVVGDVIGKYHPHGDTAVYDTIVRMAQDFSLRHPLVDGQGNFGSIDGDSPAAMRYTEIRMTRLAEEILEDIDKDTVSFGPNYDDSLLIPHVLPAKFPNLLVNGSTGIAVGMATNIPPHNLGEVIDACLHVMENPECGLAELMERMHGPDFPSSGMIMGRRGIIDAYKTGRGSITMRAQADIEDMKGDRQQIIVTEIPYQVNKARLIETIADHVRDKKIEGISDIRDESSREGMRIVIELKRGENGAVILNNLYKYTQMEQNFGIIMLALNANNQPQVYALKGMLQAFIDHRREVVTKRCLFDLKKAQDRIHILEGLKKALDQIDAVIATIRASQEAAVAKKNLTEKFGFTEAQAHAILEMRLQRLTGLERQKILDEIAELDKLITWLKTVLGDVREVYKIISQELKDIRKKYADPRKSRIVDAATEMEDEDLIAKEDVVVTITNSGYIKRIPIDTYRSQNRGGKGLKGMETRDEDFVSKIFTANTHTTLLIFTDKGKVYWLKVFKIPEGTRTSKGKSIANAVKLAGNERVCAILPIEAYSEDQHIFFVTKNGTVKKTGLDQFSNQREAGIIALTIDLDDTLIEVKLTNGKNDVFLASREGMSIRFEEEEVRSMGRKAGGVKGMTLAKTDSVISGEVLERSSEKNTILIITEFGYGKRATQEEYRSQGRGGSGLITQKITDKVGHCVAAVVVHDHNDLVVTTDKGQTIRVPCAQISTIGRNTQGVRIMNLNEGEKVVAVTVVNHVDVPTNGDGEGETSGTPVVH